MRSLSFISLLYEYPSIIELDFSRSMRREASLSAMKKICRYKESQEFVDLLNICANNGVPPLFFAFAIGQPSIWSSSDILGVPRPNYQTRCFLLQRRRNTESWRDINRFVSSAKATNRTEKRKSKWRKINGQKHIRIPQSIEKIFGWSLAATA